VSYSVCDIILTRHWYLPASKSAHQRSLNPPPPPPHPQRPHLSPRILNQRLTDLAIGIASYSNITYRVGRGGEDCGFPGSRKGRCEDAEGASSVYAHYVVMNTHTTCDSKDHRSSKLSINFPDYGWKVALFTNLI
jgi:hypothetical protein